MTRNLNIIGLLLGVLALDQATKSWARYALQGTPAQDYLGGMFRIEFAVNTGAFLSLGAEMSETSRFYIFTAGVVVFLMVALFYLFRRGGRMDARMAYGLTLLIAGGLGNLVDRIVFGHVTDFLNVGIGSLRSGIFNVADMVIIAGVILLSLPGSLPGPLPSRRSAK